MTILCLSGANGLVGESSLVIEVERPFERREFQRIYRETWPDVFRYAWLLLRHREDAEDVSAEAFRRAMESWIDGRGPRGDVLPWLLLITSRVAIDRHRRRRLIGWLPLERAPEPEDASEEAAFRRSEVWIWFDQLCRVLPAQQRDALLLRFQFDLCDADAATVLGTSVANVRTRVSRGLATLRERPEVMDR
ncbi:MAG: sigma-70 family RNA polymerase sigma factor [Candidatus Limnocylindrales bacterium]|jgi:RNA polymerase sigma factor (sigma-70 family)